MDNPATDRRANIVLVVADDLGFSDLGCYGSEIQTPALDDLAAGGIRLSGMYNTPRCCPSRAALLTGVYPTQAGVGHMTEDLGLPGYRGHLSERCATIAEILGATGYQTAMVGKWHLGRANATSTENSATSTETIDSQDGPTAHGFQRFFGTLGGFGSYFEPPQLYDGAEPAQVSDGFYYTDVIADRAASFLREMVAAGSPFFLYVAFTAPHFPLHALPADIEQYRSSYMPGWDALCRARHERGVALGVVDPDWALPGTDHDAGTWEGRGNLDWEDSRMAVYAAQVTAMDRGVGRVVATLKSLGAEDNTLVMFLSDNGGCAEQLPEARWLAEPATRDGAAVRAGNRADVTPGGPDSYMSYGPGWARLSNTPFRRYKHWTHEGGISTPFIACWPGVVPPGALNHAPAHIVDIMATCLDVAGTGYPTEHGGRHLVASEGQSLRAVLEGGPSPRVGAMFWEHEGNRAVRLGDLKLVSAHPGHWELYDIDRDRTEVRDLADRYPRDVARMASLYEDWARRSGVLPWEVVRAELLDRWKRQGRPWLH